MRQLSKLMMWLRGNAVVIYEEDEETVKKVLREMKQKMSNEIPIIKQVWQIIETHHLACTCAICTAYVKGRTPAEGMMQAADALRHQRAAGLLENAPN